LNLGPTGFWRASGVCTRLAAGAGARFSSALRCLRLRFGFGAGLAGARRVVVDVEAGALEHDADRLDHALHGACGTTLANVERILGNSLLHFELIVAAGALVNVCRHSCFGKDQEPIHTFYVYSGTASPFLYSVQRMERRKRIFARRPSNVWPTLPSRRSRHDRRLGSAGGALVR
jgi:hypothetical protein